MSPHSSAISAYLRFTHYVNALVSSANVLTELMMSSCISLMNGRNRSSGPNTLSCGIPLVTCDQLDKRLCEVKVDCIHYSSGIQNRCPRFNHIRELFDTRAYWRNPRCAWLNIALSVICVMILSLIMLSMILHTTHANNTDGIFSWLLLVKGGDMCCFPLLWKSSTSGWVLKEFCEWGNQLFL